MKPPFRRIFLGHALALAFAFSQVALAQEPPKPEEATPPPAPAAPSAPVAPATPAVEATPAAATPDVEKNASGEPALRRLDQPGTQVETRSETRTNRRYRGSSDDFPFGDHTVPKGSSAGEVVSILGSSLVDGEVEQGAVSIAGDTTVGPEGRVGGEAVAVFGDLVVKGRVRGEAVSVLGSVYVDGPVGGEVVSVLGDLELGPNAIVDGDIVVVAGQFKADPKAIVRGNRVTVPFWGTGDPRPGSSRGSSTASCSAGRSRLCRASALRGHSRSDFSSSMCSSR